MADDTYYIEYDRCVVGSLAFRGKQVAVENGLYSVVAAVGEEGEDRGKEREDRESEKGLVKREGEREREGEKESETTTVDLDDFDASLARAYCTHVADYELDALVYASVLCEKRAQLEQDKAVKLNYFIHKLLASGKESPCAISDLCTFPKRLKKLKL